MSPDRLEEDYGAVLDGMAPNELQRLLDDPFERQLLNRCGPHGPLLRPLLLAALYRRQHPVERQATLELR